jgi:hypothetical protein
MGRVRISPDRYQSFLDAFLMLGPRFSAVARRVGTDPTTARKAWEVGWPEAPYAAPIGKVYLEAAARLENAKKDAQAAAAERALTRDGVKSAQSAANEPSDRAARQSDSAPQTGAQILQQSAIDATQTEVDLLQAFRCNLIGAVLVSNKLLPGLEALATAAVESALVASQNIAQCTPDRVLRPLEKFARIVQLLTQSSKSVIEMQRLLVGAPQQITEQRTTPDAGETADRMQRAKDILSQMQRSGLLPNVDSQDDALHYEGEESNIVRDVIEAQSVVPAPEPPQDSMRSGNDEPTVEETEDNYLELLDDQRLSKP